MARIKQLLNHLVDLELELVELRELLNVSPIAVQARIDDLQKEINEIRTLLKGFGR